MIEDRTILKTAIKYSLKLIKQKRKISRVYYKTLLKKSYKKSIFIKVKLILLVKSV